MKALWTALALLLLAAADARALDSANAARLKLVRVVDDQSVELADGATSARVRMGERFVGWTLMSLRARPTAEAVLEDFGRRDGQIVFVTADGVQLDLPKTLEPSLAPASSLYLGHTPQQVAASGKDLLGAELLERKGDPDYAVVAGVFPPLRRVKLDTFDFLGTPDSADKIGFTFGGRSPNFDPAVLEPAIEAVRKRGDVWHGLVGGWLPVLRFVYPESSDTWTELVAFAPWRIVDDNRQHQPVWYRVSRIEHGALKWARYVDSYYPVPPRTYGDPAAFYADLARLRDGWDERLRSSMRVELPDTRLMNMARFALVRAIMTRVGDDPKYGVFDKDYAGTEHDGFPDTFTVETTAMLDWGLVERAGEYIDNYFGRFVEDDGALLYRGPEVGQLGRMLTVVAQYANAGGSRDLLLKRERRIDAVAHVLLELRQKALQRPEDDPAFGMLAGWCEADSSLERDPARYMKPYISNSTEAARGFRDLGRVWAQIGADTHRPELSAWGERLIREAAALRKDIEASLVRSRIEVGDGAMLPAIAGAKEPFDQAVRRDKSDPQFRAYRAYDEMMYSGSLSPEQVRSIVDYRSRHHDVLLGMPTAYNKAELAGFLAYGYGYGLIQSDMVREALLMLYSDMAHQYTRGAWMAPETRRPLGNEEAAPYCSPAQLVVPLMLRWLLVFEDPESDTLWLGKAIPRSWFADGETTSVSGARTKWGSIGFSIESHVKSGRVIARVELPSSGSGAEIRLRLRTPNDLAMREVTLNGKSWPQFDAAREFVSIPKGTRGPVRIEVSY